MEHRIEYCELDMLIARADIISLHLPLNEHTENLINRERIAKMKRGAFIINTARGGLIDEAAAAEALQSGALGGVGLDAFSEEPPVNTPLLGLEHVVATPHTGAHTAEAMQKMGMMSVDNLCAVLDGRYCANVIV
jgi:lactate dehydrogenase-like 2-hydroxyacid dehydrogenase